MWLSVGLVREDTHEAIVGAADRLGRAAKGTSLVSTLHEARDRNRTVAYQELPGKPMTEMGEQVTKGQTEVGERRVMNDLGESERTSNLAGEGPDNNTQEREEPSKARGARLSMQCQSNSRELRCSTHALDGVAALNWASVALAGGRVSAGNMADSAGSSHHGEEEDGEHGGDAVEHGCGG